ncbi:hypothetical protein GN244_ATG02295 [Phytophthora infestans]|uniref:Uncharacterized protein n=1 Tax=Phytophthora infestans TaxID=4787 RepID=A0A833WM44_PHYIN|nr:hypothetical protein GN244_ATG02295 [Phytophthora infestans]
MPRVHVLILLEDVPSETLEGPSYGEVLSRMTGPMASIRLGVDPAGGASRRISAPRDLAMQRQVGPDESIIDGPGWLLRRAVCVTEEGVFTYGQVTEYDGNTVTVTGVEGDKLVAKSDVTEVAPVIAVLLWKARVLPTIDSTASLYQAHALILDRLLGQNGQRRTRSIPKLLAGITTPASMPKASSQIPWLCPRTGLLGQLRVGHVVDFAFYVDGNRNVPARVRVGDFYNNDPTARVGRGAVPRETPARRVGHSDLQHDSDDDDENFNDLLETLVTETESANRHRPGNEEAAGADRDDELDHPTTYAILRALADKPVVLRDYAPRYQPSLDEYTRHVRLPAISDQVAVNPSPDSRARFRPTAAQQTIHQAITSVGHKGKDAMLFVEHARTSESTRFLPHPAILRRLYSFEFGPGELSVLHLVRFDLDAQFNLSNTQGVNLGNFSDKISLPPTPKTPTRMQFVSAIATLNGYAGEFCEDTTRSLVDAVHRFAESLVDYDPWTPMEIKALAFWCSKVFGSYRRAVQSDLTSGQFARSDCSKDKLSRRGAQQHPVQVVTRKLNAPPTSVGRVCTSAGVATSKIG